MSSSTPPDSDQPEQPPVPPAIKPIDLPKPDGFGNINQQSAVHRDKAKAEKRGFWSKKQGRSHPKDSYEPLRNKKGCGCGGCLVVLILLVIIPAAGTGLWMNHVKTSLTGEGGFVWSTLSGKNLTTAPTEKTAFFGSTVLYEPKDTTVEVAFVGGQWWIGGTFHEKVTFRGGVLSIEPGTRFLKGLDAEALLLETGGAQIDGDLTGKVLQQR